MLSGTAPALYGLLGYPLGHTLSPAMQQAAFAARGLEGTYLALPVPPERLAGALAGVRAWRLPGLNVTVPHKTAVLPHLDGLTPEAEAVGAVNTLYWDGDRLMGDNTDVAGFAGALGDRPAGPAVVLGAGGAARAALKVLGAAPGPVHVLARRVEAGRALLGEFGLAGRAAAPGSPEAAACLAEAALVVNATPVGLDGAASPLTAADVARLPGGARVMDLIYNPAETPLMRLARARGLEAEGGLEMLVRQGAAAFARWTGREAPVEAMRRAAGRALEALA